MEAKYSQVSTNGSSNMPHKFSLNPTERIFYKCPDDSCRTFCIADAGFLCNQAPMTAAVPMPEIKGTLSNALFL